MGVNKSLYIIDASVILKWYFENESDAGPAVMLKDSYVKGSINLGFPHYAHAEILNTMGRQLPFDDALGFFSWLLDFNIEEYRITLEFASVAVELMKKFPGISFYDAGYHALALQQGAVFITADKKYYEKTKKAGSIMLLKDYGKKR